MLFPPKRKRKRDVLAWARVNSYGLLLVGLLFLTYTDAIHPETSNTARLLGHPIALIPIWAVGYLSAAFFLLWGFVRGNTLPEIVGLFLLIATSTTRFIAVMLRLHELGVEFHDDRFVSQLLTWLVIDGTSALRLSILLSRQGLSFTIPPLRTKKREDDQDGHHS